MQNTLNDKELIIQCLKDQYKNKNVLVETIFLTNRSSNKDLHEYNANVFYFGRLTTGSETIKIRFSGFPNDYLLSDLNTSYDILFKRLETSVSNTPGRFYGYKLILIDK